MGFRMKYQKWSRRALQVLYEFPETKLPRLWGAERLLPLYYIFFWWTSLMNPENWLIEIGQNFVDFHSVSRRGKEMKTWRVGCGLRMFWYTGSLEPKVVEWYNQVAGVRVVVDRKNIMSVFHEVMQNILQQNMSCERRRSHVEKRDYSELSCFSVTVSHCIEASEGKDISCFKHQIVSN